MENYQFHDFKPTRTYQAHIRNQMRYCPDMDLIFYNGIGGFTSDGREYVITTSKDRSNTGTMGKCSGKPGIRDCDF